MLQAKSASCVYMRGYSGRSTVNLDTNLIYVVNFLEEKNIL